MAHEREHYCQKVDRNFLEKINAKKNITMEDIKSYWYDGDLSQIRYHYSSSRLFFNSRREKLSRSGASFILSKYVAKANENGSSISKKITPHCLRHSIAMHMVEAGINLIYIRDYLGHESIETTQVYAKANSEAKRKAVEKMEKISPSPSMPDWNDNPDLMKFLRGI